MKAERDAQYKSDLAQAVTDGKITQRQSDILTALISVEPVKPDASQKPDLSNLTDAERKAKMDAFRTQMEQTLVDTLNTNGLNTTVTELQAAHDAARVAGLKGHFGGPGGHKGFGIM